MGYDKNSLAKLLKKVYEFTSIGADVPEKYRRCKILGGSGTSLSFTSPQGTFEGTIPDGYGPTIKIVDDGMDALDEFVDETLKDDDFLDIIGRSAVEKQLQTLLQSTEGILPNEDLKDTVRFKIIKPLRDDIQPWFSFVPIVNLVVKTSLQLGDVSLISQEDTKQESLQFIQEHRFGGGDAEYQEQQKQAILSQMEASAQAFPSFAKVSLRAHINRVSEVAADKALIALNILRAHTHLFYPYGYKALIGLSTELSTGFWQTISLGQDEQHTFNIQNADNGPLLPFVLDTEKIEHLTTKCHIGLIQDILNKPGDGRNSLETAIILAFQSLGRAIVAPTIDMRFLGCTIALERMLIRDHEETTTERWSDRLAVILGKDSAHRQVIIQRAKKLYDLRSRIVHAAFSGVSDSDARLMERWALGVIISTLGRHKQFTTHEEFCRKIDPREIGLSIDSTT